LVPVTKIIFFPEGALAPKPLDFVKNQSVIGNNQSKKWFYGEKFKNHESFLQK
jgi:hypothetical protein